MATMKPLTLTDETWGERFRRAYRRARDVYGEGFNYRTVAETISQVYPVSMTALQRIEHHDDLPTQGRVRLVAFLALMAYGFDPADFGLTVENTPVNALDMKKVRQLLKHNIVDWSPPDPGQEPSRRNVA